VTPPSQSSDRQRALAHGRDAGYVGAGERSVPFRVPWIAVPEITPAKVVEALLRRPLEVRC